MDSVFQLESRTGDSAKALVFVIGNLDEVYTMSGEFNPDMSADGHTTSRSMTCRTDRWR